MLLKDVIRAVIEAMASAVAQDVLKTNGTLRYHPKTRWAGRKLY